MKQHHFISTFFLILILGILWLSSCTTVEKIRTGEQAIERKQYAVAQQLLESEIANARGANKSQKAFLLGEAYRLTNQAAKALEWYQNSERFGSKDDVLYWWIGIMAKQTADYSKAMEYFDRIPIVSSLGVDARRERDICMQARDWQERKSKILSTLPLDTKGSSSIYCSGFSTDNKLIVTSDVPAKTGKLYKWTGRSFSDIYLLDPENPGDLETLPGWKNRNYPQGSPTFNKEQSEMIYTLCSDKLQGENFCKLYSSRLINGQWQDGIVLNFIQPGINYSQPFLVRDSILFFSSNKLSGKGAYDIYYSVKSINGWNKPVNLGHPINTPGNENFPVMYKDTLYFSSDYLPGLGGLDLFKSHVTSNGNWSAPQNLMPPFNSSSDDFGYYPNPVPNAEKKIFFNSSRNNLSGLDHIFWIKEERHTIAQTEENTEEKTALEGTKNYKLFLSLKFYERIFEDPEDPNSLVIGKKAISTVSGIINNSDQTFTSREDGRYIREIEFDKSYTILISKEGFLQKTIAVSAQSIPKEESSPGIQTLSLEIEMSRPYFDKEIVLENIYYDLDQWYIREDAKPALDQLSKNLLDNPMLKIMIASHTDCRADEEYNIDLSNKRAKSVVDYMQSRGIEAERLSYIGYGKSRLIEKCPCESCSETQHQKNRRTTFTFLK